MRKSSALLAGLLALAVMLSGCGNQAEGTPTAGTSGAPGSGQQESPSEPQSSPSPEGGNESGETVSSLEDCRLRLIDCHPIEDNGEQLTYLAFALLGPADIGFHLEDGTYETSQAWLSSNHMNGGWRVITCDELPGGVTLDSLSLSVTDYGMAEEPTVLFSDWGEPMSKDELQSLGIYEIEGHLAMMGKGRTVIASDEYGVVMELGLIGPEYANPKKTFPPLENAAEVFHFYASDGTPLAEKVGADMSCYMISSRLYATFLLEDGMDKNTQLEKLVELAPYMEYTSADGQSLQFPLNLED